MWRLWSEEELYGEAQLSLREAPGVLRLEMQKPCCKRIQVGAERLRCHNQLSKASSGTVLYRAPLDRRELRQLATEGVEGPVEVLEEVGKVVEESCRRLEKKPLDESSIAIVLGARYTPRCPPPTATARPKLLTARPIRPRI